MCLNIKKILEKTDIFKGTSNSEGAVALWKQ